MIFLIDHLVYLNNDTTMIKNIINILVVIKQQGTY